VKTRTLLASLALFAAVVFPLTAAARSVNCVANNGGYTWSGSTASGTACVSIYGDLYDSGIQYYSPPITITINGVTLDSAIRSGEEWYYTSGNTNHATIFNIPWSATAGQTVTVNASVYFPRPEYMGERFFFLHRAGPAQDRPHLTVSGYPYTTINTNTPFTAIPSAGTGTITWDNGSTGPSATYIWSTTGTKTISATISGDPRLLRRHWEHELWTSECRPPIPSA